MEKETKICTKCGKELPITDFYWRDKAAGRRRSECKNCHNNYVKAKYKERQQDIEMIKSNLCCAKCGDSRGYVLDFHHKDPDKKSDGVAQMLRNNTPWEKIEEEMEKCIVLCANCHREFHYLENINNNFTIDNYLTQK